MILLAVLLMGGLALLMAAAQRRLKMVDVHALQSTLGGDTTVPLMLACVLIPAP
jgi:hypothetical protein